MADGSIHQNAQNALRQQQQTVGRDDSMEEHTKKGTMAPVTDETEDISQDGEALIAETSLADPEPERGCCSPSPQKIKKGVSSVSLIIVYLTVFLDIFSWGILNPILPYLATNFHANGFQVGILNSVYSFAQMIGAVVLGILSDRYGRKPILCLCLFCSATSLTATIFVNSLWSLMLTRGIAGLFAGSVSTAASYISDVTLKPGRAQYMGYIGIPIGLGMVLGPAMGGLLGVIKFKVCPPLGYDNCIDCGVSSLFAGACNIINFILAVIFVKEHNADVLERRARRARARGTADTKEQRSETDTAMEEVVASEPAKPPEPKKDRASALYALLVTFVSLFVSNFAFCMWDATAPLFLYWAWFRNDMTGATLWNGIGFAVFGLTMCAAQAFATGPAINKFGERWVIFVSCTLRAICFLSFFYVPAGPIGVIIALFVVALSGALNYSAFQTLLPALATGASLKFGMVIGFGQTVIALARATAPLVGGYLFDIDKESTILMRLFHVKDVQDLYPDSQYEQERDSGDVIFVAASLGTALVAILITFLPFGYGKPKNKSTARPGHQTRGLEANQQCNNSLKEPLLLSEGEVNTVDGVPQADV